MTINYTLNELQNMKAEELRVIAREIQMPGAWKAKKDQMVEAIENHQIILKAQELNIELEGNETTEQILKLIEAAQVVQEEPQVEEVKPQVETKKRGRKRKIEVYKNGVLFETIDGLLETFKWVTDNKITNVGWVKRSLKNNEETQAGYKYREGGYLFKYAE